MLVSSARYCPCARMEPEVGRSRPAMRLRSVDFPDPEEPRSARNSFRATESETSLTAWMVAPPMVYWRETRSSWMAVSALGMGGVVNGSSMNDTPHRARKFRPLLGCGNQTGSWG